MAVTLNASTTAGLVTSADTSGNLDLQAGGVTKIAVTSAGAAVTGALTVNGTAITSSKILQVVYGSTSTQVAIGTSKTIDVDTGLTATITPTSATSTILVIAMQSGYQRGDPQWTGTYKIWRNSTTIQSNLNGNYNNTTAYNFNRQQVTFTVLDSPASTSALTYKITYVNGDSTNAVMQESGVQTSTITLMEIAA